MKFSRDFEIIFLDLEILKFKIFEDPIDEGVLTRSTAQGVGGFSRGFGRFLDGGAPLNWTGAHRLIAGASPPDG